MITTGEDLSSYPTIFFNTSNELSADTTRFLIRSTSTNWANVTVTDNAILILEQNTSAPACSGAYAGGIIFDGTRHLGCNGNTWNALY